MNQDLTQQLQQQIEHSISAKKSLSIHASGSHQFMLDDYQEDHTLDMTQHCGVIDYQPTELTLRARSGTRISELRQLLAQNNQGLATDIPIYTDNTTLGGTIAIGHSGSGRPFRGAIRDHVLGATLINGYAELITCGGQVMKNVAGYDVSRLLCGSRGTLGPILDITLKVLPLPQTQITLCFELDEDAAIRSMNQMAGQALPITAAVFYQGTMMIRLQGTESGVRHAQQNIGGEALPQDQEFWDSIQQQTHPFFSQAEALWRIIVPSSASKLELENEHQSFIDWCGGLRWIHSDAITQSDFIHVQNLGGYIEGHKGAPATQPSSLMDKMQTAMHRKIKHAFDPELRFNPKLSQFET